MPVALGAGWVNESYMSWYGAGFGALPKNSRNRAKFCIQSQGSTRVFSALYRAGGSIQPAQKVDARGKTKYGGEKSEHTPTYPLAWRRTVSSGFLMLVLLNQASGASKVADHVRCV